MVTAAVFGFKFSLMISVGSEAQQNVINPKLILSRFEDQGKGRDHMEFHFLMWSSHACFNRMWMQDLLQTVLDQRPGTFTGLSEMEDSGSEASDSAKFGHGQILLDNLAHSS